LGWAGPGLHAGQWSDEEAKTNLYNMKFLVAGLMSLASFLTAASQSLTTTVAFPVDSATHLVTYQGASKTDHTVQELFDRAVEWLDTAFRYNTSEIRVADMQAGKIVSRQTIQVLTSEGGSFNVTFTLVMSIQGGVYKYKLTNIYYDRIGTGNPIIHVEDMMYATKKQYELWAGENYPGSATKLADAWLKPMDGYLRQTEASLNNSMTRDTTHDRNSW